MYIRGIVVRLLEGSNIGRLKDDFGAISEGDYSYRPASDRIDESTFGGKAPREWKLLVVNSNEMNAMALFGMST